jgi:Holliday junction resolvasome RuvABC ATP-dependent DNA helicase subunit
MSAFERVAQVRGVERSKVRGAISTSSQISQMRRSRRPHAAQCGSPTSVAQGRLLMRLQTHLKAAVARGDQPGQILLDGGPRLGKTTLAKAVAANSPSSALLLGFTSSPPTW